MFHSLRNAKSHKKLPFPMFHSFGNAKSYIFKNCEKFCHNWDALSQDINFRPLGMWVMPKLTGVHAGVQRNLLAHL